MPTRSRTPIAFARSAAAASLLLLLSAGCADLAPVRDFGKSAAAIAVYPQAATAYADSAVTSAPYVAGSPQTFVARSQRQAQVRDALALQAVLGDYFATLVRLAGDETFDLATAKAMLTDGRKVGNSFGDGGFDRATIDAYAGLTRTLTGFAELPARQRAVEALVRDGGPAAMRLLDALRRVSADWRAQVANDARQVDDTLEVAVLPADVPPLLRILATDRRAELAREYAGALRRMRSADAALAKVEAAHAELVANLGALDDGALRLRLKRAAADLRSARVEMDTPR